MRTPVSTVSIDDVQPESAGYVVTFCTSFTDFLHKSNELSASMKSMDENTPLTSEFVSGFIGSYDEAFTTWRDAVGAAPYPEFDGGNQLAGNVKDGFDQSSKALQDAYSRVNELNPADPEYRYKAVGAIVGLYFLQFPPLLGMLNMDELKKRRDNGEEEITEEEIVQMSPGYAGFLTEAKTHTECNELIDYQTEQSGDSEQPTYIPSSVANLTSSSSTNTTLSSPSRASSNGDLGLNRSISNPGCSGQYATIIASFYDSTTNAGNVQEQLNGMPDASYMLSSASCEVFTPTLNGNPIYAVYLGPFNSVSDACAARNRAGRDSYVKILAPRTAPDNSEIDC